MPETQFKDSLYWTHDSVINAFVYKLRRLAVVHGKKHKGMVKYESARLYWEPNSTGLIDAIEQGVIAIDFDARTRITGRGLRDHATKFRIKPRADCVQVESQSRSSFLFYKHNLIDPRFAPVGLCSNDLGRLYSKSRCF